MITDARYTGLLLSKEADNIVLELLTAEGKRIGAEIPVIK